MGEHFIRDYEIVYNFTQILRVYSSIAGLYPYRAIAVAIVSRQKDRREKFMCDLNM